MSLNPLHKSLAEKVYETWPQNLSNVIAKAGNNSERAKGWAGFVKKQLDFDFCDFARMEAGGRFKAMIAEPPRLALLLLLYPGTMGPRLYRAWQRGSESHDHREFYDVLRRDGVAITFFVFALPIMVKALSTQMQKLSGVNLLTKGKQVLQYSQFKNYELDMNNPKSAKSVLKAILAEGNVDALEKAVNNVHFHGEHEGLSKKLDEVKGTVSQLTKDYKTHLERLKSPTKALAAVEDHLHRLMSEETIDGGSKGHFVEIEKLRAEISQKAAHEGNTELLKAATEFKQDLGGALVKYAKERRLPSDFLAFATVVGLIGWLPVNANSWWNKRQFEKKRAAAAKAVAPAPSPTKVQQRPVTAFNGAHTQSPYAQHMGNYAFRQPYPQQVAGQAATGNPFLRY